jgi:hypothetical protein
MRILAKFPIPMLFALAVAAFGVFTLYGFIQPIIENWAVPDMIPGADFAYDALNFLTSLKGMLIIGGIIFVLVYVISGLVMKLIELIGKFFAWTPISIIIGLGCVVAGVVILLVPNVLGLPLPADWTAYVQEYLGNVTP